MDTFLLSGGLELKPWRLHDLRRTVATHLMWLGVSELVVGRVLKLVSQGVTARTYAFHSYESEKRSEMNTWADQANPDRKSNDKTTFG